MRRRRGSDSKGSGVPTQREVLRDVLLTAAKYDAWLTLKELARFTRFGETSISAQLRHLRKPHYGGFQVRKRQRPAAMCGVIDQHGTIWEYRIGQRTRGASRRRS